MNWDFCKTFIAVAETGSYVAAARQLRSSHPTVARQIAALQAELGANCARHKFQAARGRHGGGSAERRSCSGRAWNRHPRLGEAVDWADARRLLADDAHARVPAPPPADRDRLHHASISGQRAPARGRPRHPDHAARRRKSGRAQDRAAWRRLLCCAQLRRKEWVNQSIAATGPATTLSRSPTIVPTPNSAAGAIT
jgi:molybdenum-dependent DNA-binding transcriptional regulator ModE